MALLPLASMAATNIEKGQYVSQLANCYSCHTDTENDGIAFAGGRAMETEFGTFYTPNITPDNETGIGRWTDEEFASAVRGGVAPDGSHYFPAFPYTAYHNITDADIKALKDYLFSLTAVSQKNKSHNLEWYVSRVGIPAWKALNTYLQNSHPSDASQGAYLIDTLGHCNECHTPRNSLGILKMTQKFSGNKSLSAPDISAQGLEDWSHDELVDLFSDGALPDGDYVSDHMAEVVEFSTSKWTVQDLESAIAYLRQIK